MAENDKKEKPLVESSLKQLSELIGGIPLFYEPLEKDCKPCHPDCPHFRQCNT